VRATVASVVRAADVVAIGDLAGEALAAGSGLVEEMHEAIADRPFGALGQAAGPVRAIHDGIAHTAYASVRAGLRAASRAGAAAAAIRLGDDRPALAETRGGMVALAALNAVYGDRIADRGNGLALEMEIRGRGGGATPSPRIVVFIHGLGETERSWGYAERLQRDLGVSAVTLRYNTGLHISDNGRALARLLDELVAQWPCGVLELALIGHSMGGLVARSACHYGDCDGLRWTEYVRQVVCLGSPHLGADIEKGANVLGWALQRMPETRALGTLVNARSAGIKDLRFGSCTEEDWGAADADEFLSDRCREVPFLPGANYYFVAAAVAGGLLGAVAGDLLVRVASASGRGDGRGRHIPFAAANGVELTGLNHFDLLHHPLVYSELRRWLS
jgi:pimeloyl-ACP methyl ester carboxylesterase